MAKERSLKVEGQRSGDLKTPKDALERESLEERNARDSLLEEHVITTGQ